MGTIKNREKKIKISVGAILNLYHGQKNLIGVGVGRRVVRRLGGATYRMRLRILGSRMSRSFFNSMGLHYTDEYGTSMVRGIQTTMGIPYRRLPRLEDKEVVRLRRQG